MNDKSTGISFSMALFLVFLVLKLTHTINWSWWWITAPLWGVPVIVICILGVGAIFYIDKHYKR